MDRPKTFEVATLLIAVESGKPRDEAIKAAGEQYPDLFVEYSNRVKSGGPDHFAALTPTGFWKDPPFERVVANLYRAGKNGKDAVLSAIKQAPQAYQKYLLRLKSGEKIKFNLSR